MKIRISVQIRSFFVMRKLVINFFVHGQNWKIGYLVLANDYKQRASAKELKFFSKIFKKNFFDETKIKKGNRATKSNKTVPKVKPCCQILNSKTTRRNNFYIFSFLLIK